MASLDGPQKLSCSDLGDLEELQPLVLDKCDASAYHADQDDQFKPIHFAVHNEIYTNTNLLLLSDKQFGSEAEIETTNLSPTARHRNVRSQNCSNESLSTLARASETENYESEERLNESSLEEMLSQLPSSKWRLTSVDAILEHQKSSRGRSGKQDSCDAIFYDDDARASLETLREAAASLREKRARMEGLAVLQEHRGGQRKRLRHLNCDNFTRKVNVFGKLMRIVQAESGGAMVAFFKLLMMLLVLNLVAEALIFGAVVMPTKRQLQNESMVDLMCDIGTYPQDKGRVYLLTVGLVFFGTFVYLVMAIGRWLIRGTVWLGSSLMYTNIIFKGWDCSIASKRGAQIEKKQLVKIISDVQEEDRSRAERNTQRTLRGKLIRLAIHLLIIVIVCSEWFLIYWIVHDIDIMKPMYANQIITLILVFFSKFTKILFRLLSKFEKQSNRNILLLSVVRNLCIYLVSVLILVETELGKVDIEPPNVGNCWEQRLAKRIWAQILNTTILEIALETLITIVKLCISCIRSKIKKTSVKRSVVYKIDDRVLIIVKIQALSWIGMTVCPSVPLITAVCLLTLFFFCIVKVLVVRPRPEHDICGTNTSTLFVAAVFVTLIMCLVPVIQIIFTKKSSPGCSPFSEKETWAETVTGAASTQASRRGSGPWLALLVIAVLAIQVVALVYFVAKAKERLLKVFTLGFKLKSLCHFRKKLIKRFAKNRASLQT